MMPEKHLDGIDTDRNRIGGNEELNKGNGQTLNSLVTGMKTPMMIGTTRNENDDFEER